MKTADLYTAVGAIATAAAVIVALVVAIFAEDLKRRRSMTVVDGKASVTVFPVMRESDKRPIPHAYLRVLLAARAGKAGGHRLQVQLLSCTPCPQLGGLEAAKVDQTEFLVPLRWSFSHESFVDIPPGGARYVDLVEINHGNHNEAKLTTVDAPREGLQLVGSNKQYRITIRVLGENVHRSDHVVTFNTGSWNGADVGKPFVVSYERAAGSQSTVAQENAVGGFF